MHIHLRVSMEYGSVGFQINMHEITLKGGQMSWYPNFGLTSKIRGIPSTVVHNAGLNKILGTLSLLCLENSLVQTQNYSGAVAPMFAFFNDNLQRNVIHACNSTDLVELGIHSLIMGTRLLANILQLVHSACVLGRSHPMPLCRFTFSSKHMIAAKENLVSV